MTRPATRGVLGQFARPEDAVQAAARARARGGWRLDAYSPFPVHGLAEAVGGPRELLPAVVAAGGLAGGLGGYLLQYWAAAHAYRLDVGGRPLNSWPAFIPVTFELTVLGASLAAFLGLLALSGLPRPHHPVFGVDAFRRASRDKFFVLLAGESGFDAAAARALLSEAGAEELFDV